MSERRTYRDEDEPIHQNPEGEPVESTASKAFGVVKSMLMLMAGAAAGAAGIEIYRKLRQPKEQEEFIPNPAMGAMTGMVPGAPQIMPMPMPIPMPWPVGGGMGGMGITQPAPIANSKADKLTKAEELELARLHAETSKNEAIKAQADAYWREED